MKKEIKITFTVESKKQLRSNHEIKENLEEMIFDEIGCEDELDLQNLEIIVKDILK